MIFVFIIGSLCWFSVSALFQQRGTAMYCLPPGLIFFLMPAFAASKLEKVDCLPIADKQLFNEELCFRNSAISRRLLCFSWFWSISHVRWWLTSISSFLCAKCISCSLSPPLVSCSVWLLLSVMKKESRIKSDLLCASGWLLIGPATSPICSWVWLLWRMVEALDGSKLWFVFGCACGRLLIG